MVVGEPTEAHRVIAGRYALTAKLGSGGFGSVYLAHDQVLMRDVAVKLITSTSADHRERFLREARATARLHHPHIVGIHDAGDDAGTLYLVLELVTGRPLDALLSPEGMEPRRVKRIVAQIAEALAAAHAAGIVHRDIKPSNILIDSSDSAKIADFGIARSAHDAHLTNSSTLLGTLRYMAPEQLRGGESVNPAADLFSLGLVAYEMLTGRSAGGNREFTAEERVRAPDLTRIVKRLLSEDPAARGTAEQLERELGGASAERSPLFRRMALVALAIALITGGVLYSRLDGNRTHPTQRPISSLRLSHARSSDLIAAMDGGRLAGVPISITARGTSSVEISAADDRDLSRATQAIRVFDALSGSSFLSEPNLFTGSKASVRVISCAGDFAIADFISFVAYATHWPLVVDGSAKRGPTMRVAVQDAPWDEAVRNLIASSSLTTWRDGDVWILESQQRQRERERIDPHAWVSFQLNRPDKSTVIELIRPMLSEWGAAAVSHDQQIVVCDTLERLKALKPVIGALDRDAGPSSEQPAKSRYSGERISLNLRDADLVDLLHQISRLAHLPLVIDSTVRGSVSVSLTDVPWDNALGAILLSQALAYSSSNSGVTIVPESKMFNGAPIERTIHLRHEKPTFFRAFAKALSPALQIVIADDASGTLVLRGEPSSVENSARVIARIDE